MKYQVFIILKSRFSYIAYEITKENVSQIKKNYYKNEMRIVHLKISIAFHLKNNYLRKRILFGSGLIKKNVVGGFIGSDLALSIEF